MKSKKRLIKRLKPILKNVKCVVSKGADVRVDNDYVLYDAVRNGDLENVKDLVSKGADVRVDNDLPLRVAAYWGKFEVVKYLVEECGADVCIYVLRWAVGQGHLEVVKYLVSEAGADVHVHDDWTLRWAVYKGHLKIVKYLKTYNVSKFIKKHIDKQIHIEQLNQVFKEIRLLPDIGIDYQNAFEHFNHLKNTFT